MTSVGKNRGLHHLYAFLTDKAANPQFSGRITWNFNKFLLDRKGNVVARFDSKDDPLGDKIPPWCPASSITRGGVHCVSCQRRHAILQV